MNYNPYTGQYSLDANNYLPYYGSKLIIVSDQGLINAGVSGANLIAKIDNELWIVGNATGYIPGEMARSTGEITRPISVIWVPFISRPNEYRDYYSNQ